jgi:AcrR family transcriptional regulator
MLDEASSPTQIAVPMPRPPAPPSLISHPQQRRSRATHDAIVRAFRDLLETTPLEQITVAEIARRAGSSVGGVYARFTSKEAMLLPVVDSLVVELRESLDSSLSRVAERGSLADIIQAYVGPMIAKFREHRVLLRQTMKAVDEDTARAIGLRLHEFNEFAHERFRTLAWERREEIRHRKPRVAIELALFIGSAAGRDGVLSENWRSYTVQPDDTTLAREIGLAMLGYLTSAPPKRG